MQNDAGAACFIVAADAGGDRAYPQAPLGRARAESDAHPLGSDAHAIVRALPPVGAQPCAAPGREVHDTVASLRARVKHRAPMRRLPGPAQDADGMRTTSTGAAAA